ncbi:MAG TPA: HNH endonuclease family protein [Kribbella sp.]
MRRLVAVLALLAATTGCAATAAEPGSQASPSLPATAIESASPSSAGATASALTAELAKVKVIPARPSVPGYDRSCKKGHGCVFGSAWKDVDRNGCDTRNDVLKAQLTAVEFKNAKRCVVVAGTLQDPYTGRTIEFRKAQASKVQIDHVYPLGRAWDMGAAKWPADQRVAFANDQDRNLLAVDGKTNESKGDDGPGEWMPLNKGFRCEYVLRYLRVADAYRLPITKDDADAVRAVLPSCGSAK